MINHQSRHLTHLLLTCSFLEGCGYTQPRGQHVEDQWPEISIRADASQVTPILVPLSLSAFFIATIIVQRVFYLFYSVVSYRLFQLLASTYRAPIWFKIELTDMIGRPFLGICLYDLFFLVFRFIKVSDIVIDMYKSIVNLESCQN